MRRLAANAVIVEGLSITEAARVFGVTRQSVSSWVNRARRDGEAALAAGRRGRRPGEQQALSAVEQRQIVGLITDKNPDQLKLPFALWTRQAVRDLIWQRFTLRLALTTVGQYLRRWGFTPQKPLRRAFEQDSAAVKRWLNEQYPAIARRAKRENAVILWGDEMGLRSDDHRGRSYGLRGVTPIVPKTGKRFGCSVIQAVSNRGELCFRVFSGSFNADLFIDFLKRLLKHADGRKIFLIVDGHPVHRSHKAAAWLAARTDLIELHRLPGYSPELNPAELQNNDTKHAVLAKTRPRNQAELLATTRQHLHKRQKQPHLVRSFFEHPDVAYAA